MCPHFFLFHWNISTKTLPDFFPHRIQICFPWLRSVFVPWADDLVQFDRFLNFTKVKPRGLQEAAHRARACVCWAMCVCVLASYSALFLHSMSWLGLGGLRVYFSWVLRHAGGRTTRWDWSPLRSEPLWSLAYLGSHPGFLRSEQVGSWRLEKHTSWVYSPCLPHSPQTQPTGQGKLF